MTAVFKPMSFSLCDENREYILAKVAEGKKKSKKNNEKIPKQ